MLEKEIEKYFVWTVERMGGKTWKFTSPGGAVWLTGSPACLMARHGSWS